MFQQLAESKSTKAVQPYSGVGVVIEVAGATNQKTALLVSESHPLIVKEVLPNSPAAKAGVQIKDRILKINNVGVDGLTVKEAASKIRGDLSTPVTLIIQAVNEQTTRSVSLLRSNIH